MHSAGDRGKSVDYHKKQADEYLPLVNDQIAANKRRQVRRGKGNETVCLAIIGIAVLSATGGCGLLAVLCVLSWLTGM